ncbi:MAG: DUF547 domain-containing protein [Cyclobacteriaceae bacterium]
MKPANRVMVRLFALLTLSTLLLDKSFSQDLSFFRSTEQFLKTYVIAGKVDFKSLDYNSESLDSLITQIDTMALDDRSDDFKKAFYINAYNLLVIHGVLQAYPVASPLDIEGFFTERKFRVAGINLTLDELEFKVLFNSYKDLRLHFILNCGAKSCPTLFSDAITPSELEEQLNFSTAMVMDRDDFVNIDHANDQIKVSRIFEWYGDMFEEYGMPIRKFIDHNRFETLPGSYEIVFDEYDWSLNEL